jgi:TatD DNase family protein
MFIDSHCHLGHKEFRTCLPEVLHRATAAGVTQCIMPATDLVNTRVLIELAAQHPQLHACAGIHPCDVHLVPQEDLAWLTELRSLATTPGIAAIGETGMDAFHPPEPGYTRETWLAHQAYVLRHQLDLAEQLHLPAILHARECHDLLVDQVRPYTGRVRCVFHCFTGSLAQAQEVIAMGHLVSFTGVVTFKRNTALQEVARQLPAGSFMIETDAPFLAPEPHRGKLCEPAFAANTGAFVATLRGESLETLAAHTSATARAFFHGL